MISVSRLLNTIRLRQRDDELRQLDDLSEPEREAAIAALSAVPGDAMADVGKLVSEVRRQAQERAEAEAAKVADPMGILKFRMSLMSTGELETLRDELRAEREPTIAWQTIFDRLDRIAERLRGAQPRVIIPDEQPVEPDEELDGDDAPKPKKRSIPRRRSRRGAEPEPPARYIGPRICGPGDPDRPYGCPVGADYERWQNPSPPPWLITDEQTEAAAP